MNNKTELIDTLKHNICEVTFTKVNGEVRQMPCTLRKDMIPPATSKGDDFKPKKLNDSTLSVWCLDKSEWRSFRISNVTEIKILN
jgi:hypothetical protein